MDIYILRDGEQIGPFSRDAAQILIAQGTVSEEDLAWREGAADWRPLNEVVNDGGEAVNNGPVETSSPAEPVAAATPERSAAHPTEPAPKALPELNTAHSSEAPPAAPPEPCTEPATAGQIAFLSYFAVAMPAGLMKDAAEELIVKATADPQNVKRLTAWEVDRLRLHPDLFSTEVQAKKEDRVQLFYDLCQTAGADHFNGVTKAHCQVLVAYLDVKFPRWDAHGAEATERYFFPAIAEKFPQLVDKAWRGRLHYGDGQSAAARARKANTTKLVQKSGSAFWAIVRGIVLGLLILAVIYLVYLSRQEAGKGSHPPAEKVGVSPANPAKSAAGPARQSFQWDSNWLRSKPAPDVSDV